jgi:phage head maturation protease
MTGHPVVFNEWTEINSVYEGHFMERIAPGAAHRTIDENSARMKVLFNHGRDPSIGMKPLGPPEVLREDGYRGVYAEVPLIDADYVRDTLVPGLGAGLYGWSFRFDMVRWEDVKTPGASAHNPKGLTERTVRELTMPEFGPVTFPAYAGAELQMRARASYQAASPVREQPPQGVEPARAMRIDGELLVPGMDRFALEHAWVVEAPRCFRPIDTCSQRTRDRFRGMQTAERTLDCGRESRRTLRLP